MKKLEKILEEIGELRGQAGSECTSEDHYIKKAWEHCLDRVVGIIRKHMNDSQCGECSRRRWYQIGYKDGKRMNDGWIPVEERLPEEPKENPVFDDKPLELYLVDMGGSYPLRAFWNGKEFTDGWSVLKVTAWMPLPEPYRPERSSDEKE